MKVIELIALLQTFPPDLKVVMPGEAGGIDEVTNAYETMICNNRESQPRYFFGLISKDSDTAAEYRLSNSKNDLEVQREVALLLEY